MGNIFDKEFTLIIATDAIVSPISGARSTVSSCRNILQSLYTQKKTSLSMIKSYDNIDNDKINEIHAVLVLIYKIGSNIYIN